MATTRGNGTDPGADGPLLRGGKIVRGLERWKYLNVALSLTICGFLGGAFLFLREEARAEGDRGFTKATELEVKFDEHIKSEQQLHNQQTQLIQQTQTTQAADIQALYRFLLTRERQPRLERPLDAGAPLTIDGGP